MFQFSEMRRTAESYECQIKAQNVVIAERDAEIARLRELLKGFAYRVGVDDIEDLVLLRTP